MTPIIHWAILSLMIVVIAFKWMLWRLTGFWAFLVFVVAFSYVACTRTVLIIWPHARIDTWVGLFWPLCVLAVVGLYVSLRRYMT
jgi:hypothetical protein